jgi:hypothetical protein
MNGWEIFSGNGDFLKIFFDGVIESQISYASINNQEADNKREYKS